MHSFEPVSLSLSLSLALSRSLSQGLATEFMSAEEARLKYGPTHVFEPGAEVFPDTHRMVFPAGDWTDDTDQMILILQSLFESAGLANPALFGKQNGVLFAFLSVSLLVFVFVFFVFVFFFPCCSRRVRWLHYDDVHVPHRCQACCMECQRISSTWR